MTQPNQPSIYAPSGRQRYRVQGVPVQTSDGRIVYSATVVEPSERIVVEDYLGATGPVNKGVVLAKKTYIGMPRYRAGATVKGVPREYTLYSPSLPLIGGHGTKLPKGDYQAVARRGASDKEIVGAYLDDFYKNTEKALDPSWREVSGGFLQRLLESYTASFILGIINSLQVTSKKGSTKTIPQFASSGQSLVKQALTNIQKDLLLLKAILEGRDLGRVKPAFKSPDIWQRVKGALGKSGAINYPIEYQELAYNVKGHMLLDVLEAILEEIKFDGASPPNQKKGFRVKELQSLVEAQESVRFIRESGIIEDPMVLAKIAGPVVARFVNSDGYNLVFKDVNQSDSTETTIAITELQQKLKQLAKTMDDPGKLLPITQ